MQGESEFHALELYLKSVIGGKNKGEGYRPLTTLTNMEAIHPLLGLVHSHIVDPLKIERG